MPALDFSNMEPTNVFFPEKLAEYHTIHGMLWLQVSQLGRGLLMLRRWIEFPWPLLYPDYNTPTHFYHVIRNSLIEAAVVRIVRLTKDVGANEPIDLSRFKDKIADEYLKSEESKAAFRIRWKTASGSGSGTALKGISKFRHKEIAHLALSTVLGSNQDPVALTVTDLETEFQRIEKMYNATSFPMRRSAVVRRQDKEYIADFLNKFAETSALLRSPESNIPQWEQLKVGASDDLIASFNRYRENFNLPTVE